MKINGKDVEMDRPMTVKDLVAGSGHCEDRVAVELNGRIIPRSRYADVSLKEGDSVEIVGFVGGG